VRAVIQRVTSALVRVDDTVVGEIGGGLLVLVGVSRNDTEDDAKYIAERFATCASSLATAASRWIAPVVDVRAACLSSRSSPSTATCAKGGALVRRGRAAGAARALYEAVVRELRAAQVPVATGQFQAMMHVEMVNDGPVTVLVDSAKQF
jgi:D-tyrosyl-tRNA(Tyr) deacylase